MNHRTTSIFRANCSHNSLSFNSQAARCVCVCHRNKQTNCSNPNNTANFKYWRSQHFHFLVLFFFHLPQAIHGLFSTVFPRLFYVFFFCIERVHRFVFSFSGTQKKNTQNTSIHISIRFAIHDGNNNNNNDDDCYYGFCCVFISMKTVFMAKFFTTNENKTWIQKKTWSR